MTLTYELIDETQGIVYTRATGVVGDADILAHERALLNDPRIQPGFRQLLDLRWVREDQITEQVVEPLLALHRRYRQKLTWSHYAVVALSSAWFRLGAHYSRRSEHVSMIVFNEPNTACIWLGIAPDLPECQVHSVPEPLSVG
jgi:hypothetical protein